MKCSRCGKYREVLFNRAGGIVPLERIKELNPRTINKGDTIIKAHNGVCAPCIKVKLKDETWLPGEIITNPTKIPTGDPLEWVIADE